MKKVLVHICCGPCAIYPVDALRERGFETHGYFFNPNIHPCTEYEKRKKTLQDYAERIALPVVYAKEYPIEEYFRHVAFREAERCRLCYTIRLRQAAGIARHGKFDCFTTTLLVSPYQKHELIREVGEAAGREFNIPFHYEDFRTGFKEATTRSKAMGMYRQQYCGCIFSEMERYRRKDDER
ncbi:epoxyqueuosine reductase QueH [Desulforudis sp. 1088]|uniref:epoxyqueuosine reductase QueH n=1 Tax=unclassified Candidatus Desulforudis TaxID=2635950 RepID=UPI003486F9A8